MKLKSGFIAHTTDEEYIAVATGEAEKVFNGMIHNNETADFIFRQLLKDTTEDKIVEAMAKEYDAPKEVIAKDVYRMVERLRAEGFLDEERERR